MTKNSYTKQHDFIKQVIGKNNLFEAKQTGFGEAPINIALAKYWGKRDKTLNLPTNSSLSISLPKLGTKTKLKLVKPTKNTIQAIKNLHLNQSELDINNPFRLRLDNFLKLFKSNNMCFEVETINTVPTSAGLASSASGYAAIVLALNDLFNWELSLKQLSLLARLGSGSACRSMFTGFSLWNKGQRNDGMDSYATSITSTWNELCIGLIKVDIRKKSLSSSEGMQRTVKTSKLYQCWQKQAEEDILSLKQAIKEKDFITLGKVSEHNALSMHATMISSWPPILYWQTNSLKTMQKVWGLRQQKIDIYFTMDAGPNLKLMFLEKDINTIKQVFKNVDIIQPFIQT